MAPQKFSNIALIVQCRLSSTRLPQKALKILGQSESLCWTLSAMKKVPASRYFLACDFDSKAGLEKIAEKCGWEIFSGELENVLGRFCSLIEAEFPECDLIVRATGDNPFLFYEAAELSIREFEQNHFDADYFTFTGLPHGSGVELFKARSLLNARESADSAYDLEHVGPAFYRHQDIYKCVFEKAPEAFFAPDLRTTIDSFADYKRAERLVDFLSKSGAKAPFRAEQILSALKNSSLKKTILFVPSVKVGRGTGHLRRCLELARELSAFVYIPDQAALEQTGFLLQSALSNGLNEWQIVKEPLGGWDLIVLDLFRMSKEEACLFGALGPVCALDDGGAFCGRADFILGVIPSMPRKSPPQFKANLFCPALLDLPKKRRAEFPKKIQNALVCVSGETREELSGRAFCALAALGVKTTIVDSKNPVENLRERLADYDLVVTHYGFTAFEALAAGCAVLLVATSALHERLSKRYGFVCLKKRGVSERKIGALLKNPAALKNQAFKALLLEKKASPSCDEKNSDAAEEPLEPVGLSGLAKEISRLSNSQKFSCPVCGSRAVAAKNFEAARTKSRSFRRCSKCGSLYLAFSCDGNVRYEADYFGNEYKAQYGKTYLEDFDSIKAQGARRAKNILAAPRFCLLKRSCAPRLLDIGCAYGPFLAAAKEAGFEPFGTDISKNALDYVEKSLGFKCVLSSFADFDIKKTFGFERFDAVTMWYVIEHCRELDGLLRRCSSILKKGGVFCFSTPSASGASARFNRQKFFEQSPRDHYSLWEPGRAARILRRYGFRIYKIVYTGIHPERIEIFKNVPRNSFIFGVLSLFCRLLGLGDTFELYCVKVEEGR